MGAILNNDQQELPGRPQKKNIKRKQVKCQLSNKLAKESARLAAPLQKELKMGGVRKMSFKWLFCKCLENTKLRPKADTPGWECEKRARRRLRGVLREKGETKERT